MGIEAFLLVTLICCLGAIVQAATGVGAGMFIAPLLALVSLKFLPGPLIFASLLLTITMSIRGRSHINLKYFYWLMSGITLGSLLAGFSLTLIPQEKAGIFFGLLILLMVIVTAIGKKVTYSRTSFSVIGALAGFIGTISAIAAPLIAMLYQHESSNTLRSTLALIYLIASVMSLIILHYFGRFNLPDAQLGMYLIPGFLGGYLLSGKVTRILDRGYSRIAVLTVSTISAIILILRSLY